MTLRQKAISCHLRSSKVFPRSTVDLLHTTKNSLEILETFTNLYIEQLGVCSVRLRHKDNIVRCRFFVVPHDGSLLLGMLDIVLLEILNIMYEVLDQQISKRHSPYHPFCHTCSGGKDASKQPTEDKWKK